MKDSDIRGFFNAVVNNTQIDLTPKILPLPITSEAKADTKTPEKMKPLKKRKGAEM
jgi:hypothetical protein